MYVYVLQVTLLDMLILMISLTKVKHLLETLKVKHKC